MRLEGVVVGLPLLFIAGLAPFAGTFFEHYPDERNYTNAAITMVNTGEYVTPRWPDGHPNVHKPILTYWVVAASYALFGVGLAATRLPFMVAGGLVIALTYVLARRLEAGREAAVCAAVIAFSEPELILASMRAIPDVLLCLFMLVSAYGFLSLIVLDRRTPDAYWAAYLGAALAVETKGLLAVVFVAFAWLFAMFDRSAAPGQARLRPLIHVPSMLGSVAVAAWWYVAMYWLHGPAPSKVFFGDQIAWNLKVFDGSPIYRIPAYLAVQLSNLLPWSLLLVPLALYDRKSLAPSNPPEQRAQRFVIAWSLLMVLIFGLGDKIEPRYLLPAGPLWAILLGRALDRADPRLVTRALGCLLGIVLVLFAGFGLVLSFLDGILLGTGSAALLVSAMVAAATVIIAITTWNAGQLPRILGVGVAVFLVFPLTVVALGPALRADAGVGVMARELERSHRDGQAPVLVTGPEFLANKLRVITGGRVAIDSWSHLPAAHDRWPDTMIIPVREARVLDLTGYRAYEVPTEVRSVPVAGLLQAMLQGRVAEFLDARRERYVIAVRT